MKRMSVHCKGGVHGGLKMLTELLRKDGILESQIINCDVSSEALYCFAYIREDDTLKVVEAMKKKLKKANDLLNSVAMTLSGGQAIKPDNMINDHIKEFLSEN